MGALEIQPAKMKVATTLKHSSGFCGGTFDAVTQRYLAGCTDGRILAYNWPEWGDPTPFGEGHKSYVHLLQPLPSRQQVVSGGYDRKLVWWDVRSGLKIRDAATVGRPLGMAVSPDESKLAVVGDDRIFRLYDNQTGERIAEWATGHAGVTAKGNASSVYSTAFSPDGLWVACGDRIGDILVREVATGNILRTISAPRFYSDFNKLPDGSLRVGEYELGGVRSLIFTPDGKVLIAGGMDQYDPNSAGIDGKMGLFGFEAATGKSTFELTLPKGKGYLQSLMFHPVGLLIAAGGGGAQGSGKGTVCVVDLEKPQDAVIHEVEMTIRAVALTPDGRHLIAAGMLKVATAGQIEVWTLD